MAVLFELVGLVCIVVAAAVMAGWAAGLLALGLFVWWYGMQAGR